MYKRFGSAAALVAMAGFSGALVGCGDQYGSELEETSVNPIPESTYEPATESDLNREFGETYGEFGTDTPQETQGLNGAEQNQGLEGYTEMEDQPSIQPEQQDPLGPPANQPMTDQAQPQDPLMDAPAGAQQQPNMNLDQPASQPQEPQQQPAEPLPPMGQ